MDKDQIRFGDWNRILFGESSPAYLLEVVVRVGVIYLLIMIAIRFMGKRMAGQIGRLELVARVSLAAAVGLPIQRPDRGILGPAVIAIVIVVIGRWISYLASRSKRFDKIVQGIDATLVRDGLLDLKRMMKVRVTRERLFAELRKEDIRHLGQVKRLYMEANGEFSLVKNDDEQPGLCIIPEWDTDLRQQQQPTEILLCKLCGNKWNEEPDNCDRCVSEDAEYAVLLPEANDPPRDGAGKSCNR